MGVEEEALAEPVLADRHRLRRAPDVARAVPVGGDVGGPVVDAGVDEIYVQQIGPDMDGFFDAWERDVLPEFQTSAYA